MLNFLITQKESITLLIAITSFILSIGQLIITLLHKRTSFTVNIENLETSSSSNYDVNTFLFTINNNSSSPIAITKILIISSQNNYSCCLKHQWIGERYYPKFPETDIPSTERILTVDFPIQLTAHQSFTGFVTFHVEKSELITNNKNQVKFKFITNKKPKTIVLNCPEESKGSIHV